MSELKKVTELKQQQELSDTTDNKQLTSKFEELKNTPFTIVKENEKYFGILSKYRITDI